MKHNSNAGHELQALEVLFITNIPSPYRVEFFNELGKYCRLTVWFEAETEANREWQVSTESMNFKSVFLKGITVGLDKHINWSIVKRLKQSRFDLYIMGCYSSPTEMAAIQWLKSNNIPFLLNSDGGLAVPESRWKYKVKKYFISAAAGWLSSGSRCTGYLTHYGADPEHIMEYPFASHTYCDEERAPMPAVWLEAYKTRERLKKRVILAVGQFIPRKGFTELLEACTLLDDGETSLVIAGGGPLKAEYQSKIRELGLKNVILKDFLNREQLIALYKAADVFVLPTYYDVWGLVINEALAFGLPVVTTTGAGAAYNLVMNERNGFVVNPDRMNDLAMKCKYLLDHEEIRQQFSAASLEISERYTMKNMVLRHVECLEAFHRLHHPADQADRIV